MIFRLKSSPTLFLACLFTFNCILTSCQRVEIPLPPVDINIPESLRIKTFKSFRKVDDYPLYVMHYYGDYGFENFLRKGIDVNDKRNDVWRCTCFAALNDEGDMVFGRNFDYTRLTPLLLFTHPLNAYASVAMTPIEHLGDFSDNPRISTLEAQKDLLYAPYRPLDGMNECGLTVSELGVDGEFVYDPDKVTLTNLHTTRLLLDYAKNVDEALELLHKYNNIASRRAHYLIADAQGNSAIVEYSGGKVVATRNDVPWQAVTNIFAHGKTKEALLGACDRYRHAYGILEKANGRLSNAEGMRLLEQVSVTNSPVPGGILHDTQWSVIYGMKTGDIHVTMGRKYNSLLPFELKMRNKR